MSLKTSSSTPLLRSQLVSCAGGADIELSTPIRKIHLRPNSSGFRKVRSETDLHRLNKQKGERSYADSPADVKSLTKSMYKNRVVVDNHCSAGEREREADVDPIAMYIGCGGGGGFGIVGGGDADSNYNNNGDTDAYYQKMLEANPGNPLLLRNYARFLQEVKHDMVKAEEYYERAMLANPSDGDVLANYAKLIWQLRNDRQRAQMYFDRAVEAASDDIYVLASHAHFLWNTEEEEEEDDGSTHRTPNNHFRGSTYTNIAATCC